jgi:hypothetical protein
MPEIEYFGVAVGDLPPEFPVVEQLASLNMYFGCREKNVRSK